jgi:hypothetical protein
MLSSRIARLSISAAAALALPIGGAIAFSAGPAGASAKSTITCTKVSGNIATSVKLKGCNGNTGTKSKAIPIASFAGGGTVTWKSGKTTTFAAPTTGTGTKCPASSTNTDETFSGTVSADTTGSAKPIPGKYKGEVCINGTTGAITIAPGTTVTAN